MDGPLETVRDEDFVEYFLFVRSDDSRDNAEQLTERVDRLKQKALKLVDRLADQYIWHKDRFNLISRFRPSAELRQSFPTGTSDGNAPYRYYYCCCHRVMNGEL